MSLRWIRNVVIDGEKSTVEIQLGDHKIGDKCYIRIGNAVEMYFDNVSETREDIVAQGIDILRKRLEGKKVMYPDGRAYEWQ